MDVTVATGWKRLYMVMCQQIWRQIIIVPNKACFIGQFPYIPKSADGKLKIDLCNHSYGIGIKEFTVNISPMYCY